jgi:hypothetical protein
MKSLGPAVSGVANSETIVLQSSFPINTLQANDTIRIWLTGTKSGATDNYNVTVRIGTAGTTADTAVTGLSSFALMSASGRSGGGIFDIKVVSSTSVLKVGNNGTGNAAYLVGSTAAPAATTITDASANALFVSLSIASSSTTDTVAITSGQIVHHIA